MHMRFRHAEQRILIDWILSVCRGIDQFAEVFTKESTRFEGFRGKDAIDGRTGVDGPHGEVVAVGRG